MRARNSNAILRDAIIAAEKEQMRGRTTERDSASRSRSGSPREPPSIATRTRSRSGGKNGIVQLPTRERLDRLRRSYGDELIDELTADLEEMNIITTSSRDTTYGEDDLIECVYDPKSRSIHPVVTGSRGGKYFYSLTEGRKYIKEKQIEMVNPDTTPIVDLNPALKVSEVVPKTYTRK